MAFGDPVQTTTMAAALGVSKNQPWPNAGHPEEPFSLMLRSSVSDKTYSQVLSYIWELKVTKGCS